ncbi:hypothetical protein IV203_030285 [Nitzschia inconspicua]|uniref:Uncharacterized protein n=1 Tax=Nitzschia inconspicua TaxID=303405 RepID=A0A9K3LTC7_9STRA|nr:hypothetical protein IV203_030285 [Nitzschia inconspicua]
MARGISLPVTRGTSVESRHLFSLSARNAMIDSANDIIINNKNNNNSGPFQNPMFRHESRLQQQQQRWFSSQRRRRKQQRLNSHISENVDDEEETFQGEDDHEWDSEGNNSNIITENPLFWGGPNPGLASIISQGRNSLEKSAADIEHRTRHISLSRPHKKGSFRAGTLEPRQLAEGQRVLDVASECLEDLVVSSELQLAGQAKGLVLAGEPIVFLECVVNRTIKQAKLYWTLPYGLLLDDRMNARLYRQLTTKVQQQLLEGGATKLLSREIHRKLSSYYPPRIQLHTATDEMVAKALKELAVGV